MNNVGKDERDWKIVLVLDRSNCPYIYYSAGCYGCNHPLYKDRSDAVKYTPENCPAKFSLL